MWTMRNCLISSGSLLLLTIIVGEISSNNVICNITMENNSVTVSDVSARSHNKSITSMARYPINIYGEHEQSMLTVNTFSNLVNAFEYRDADRIAFKFDGDTNNGNLYDFSQYELDSMMSMAENLRKRIDTSGDASFFVEFITLKQDSVKFFQLAETFNTGSTPLHKNNVPRKLLFPTSNMIPDFANARGKKYTRNALPALADRVKSDESPQSEAINYIDGNKILQRANLLNSVKLIIFYADKNATVNELYALLVHIWSKVFNSENPGVNASPLYHEVNYMELASTISIR